MPSLATTTTTTTTPKDPSMTPKTEPSRLSENVITGA